jgi:hypothetical protein
MTITVQRPLCSYNMKWLLFTLILICPKHLSWAQEVNLPANSDFEHYKQLNAKEFGLAEYKDDDDALRIKLTQLEIINRSRKNFRVAPVSLDILASRVANKICREAAENKYISHWNLAGEKPYHRYAFAGGYDHVSENAFGSWSSGRYEISGSVINKMMQEGHGTFMAEKAPNDGHKKNIIDKTHNFVGIGFFITNNQFRYYEEFIDRYLEFEKIPSQLKVNEQASITVKPIGADYLYFLIVYRDKFPQPQRVSQLSRRGSYEDFSNEEYLTIPGWDLSRYRNRNTYKIPLNFTKEGLYYIQIFLDKKEYKGSTALNTKGKSAVSGIVIRVSR